MDESGVSLGLPIAVSIGFVVAMTLIHGAGVVTISRMLNLEDRSLKEHRVDLGAFGLLVSFALCLFALHLTEIALFAIFYVNLDAVRDLETALYFSASAYTTLGQPDIQFPVEWRLVGAMEGLIGFLLIGWSTAVFVTDVNKLLRG